jgi:predicted NUDIX family NTP pyrophosphohydrolase
VASRVSAGILLFRRRPAGIEVLLAHPGGPLFTRKDAGHWTIPKGEVEPGEELLAVGRREFEEETGQPPPAGPTIELGSIVQKGGKTVHAWAFEVDPRQTIRPKSNTFQMEWPPHSGKMQAFPEIDRAEFFPLPEAEKRINEAQRIFLDRLRAKVGCMRRD